MTASLPSDLKAVTFDAAGTLLFPYPSVGAVYREVMARHGCAYDSGLLEAGFRRAFQVVAKPNEAPSGEERDRTYWREVVAASIKGLQPPPKDFDSLFEDLWQTFADSRRWRLARGARPLLRRLKERGYRVGLLSNWDSRARSVLKGKRLLALFDGLFISSEIGCEKPDPRAFLAAADALDAPPTRLLHVGDSWREDVCGALDAGCRAVWINPLRLHPERPCLQILRLHDLNTRLPSRPTPSQTATPR